MFCPKCGSEIRPGSNFCGKCGTQLVFSHNEAEQTSQETVPSNAIAESSNNVASTGGVSQPTLIDVPPTHEAPETRPSPSFEPVTTGASAPSTQGPTPTPKKSRLIIVLAACVGVVAMVLLVFFTTGVSRQGASNARVEGNASIIQGVQPAVVDKRSGKTITALERPQLVTPTRVEATIASTLKPANIAVEPGLSNVLISDWLYLTDSELSILQKYGFCISGPDHDNGYFAYREFFERYESNRYSYVPSFVTVDSLMHTYHLYYQHLLKNVEHDYLAPALAGMSKQLLEASVAQYQTLKGSEWESAAQRNVAFFGVGALLQDSSVSVPSYAKDAASIEFNRIQAASSMEASALTKEQEDYTQYKPRGYYEGDETLERYFRAMMWYGRINFTQKEEDLDRSALLMTMALQGETQQRWEAIYTITSFFAGVSDDCGYFEYKPLLDAVYGPDATAEALVGNTDAWTHYHELTASMPAPQINSIPGSSDSSSGSALDAIKGWRLMGQRFSLDAMVFQNLVYSSVKQNANGIKRTLPDALDIPAAMGSDEALSILESRGATEFKDYEDNMNKLRTILSNDEDTRWNASLYSQWLYTLKPLLSHKDENYPSFMQSSQWARKSLQSYLGSYTELKHDSILHSKQVLSEGAGSPPEADDRGYVEAEPVVFARLANLTNATITGLSNYNLISEKDRTNLDLLRQLADKLSIIASKELQNELPTDEEFELIRSYGEQLEHFWLEVYKDIAENEYQLTKEFPAAIVTDVATDAGKGTVLELGTGLPNTMYVIVPVGGTLRLAVGAVYSFYQFEQPAADRLTDTQWRTMMGFAPNDNGKFQNGDIKSLEDWTQEFTADASRD